MLKTSQENKLQTCTSSRKITQKQKKYTDQFINILRLSNVLSSKSRMILKIHISKRREQTICLKLDFMKKLSNLTMKQLKFFQIKWIMKQFRRFIKNYLTLKIQEPKKIILLNKDLIISLKIRIKSCLNINRMSL